MRGRRSLIVSGACAWLSVAGACAAAASEPSAGAGQDVGANPQPQTREEAKSPLTPMAQQYLEAAKARLEAERAAQAQRERARQREQAQQLAIQISREKLKQQAAQEREAQRQVRLARERQLKTLYQKALSRYQQGAYQDAAVTLQQMVVLDPTHPLVKAADRLIARSELKHFEQRLRASAKLPPQAGGANVPGLEQLLTQKRMELETVLKYAKSELQAERYDAAEKLLTAILVQDPSQRQAQQLLEQVQLARLNEERVRLTRSVERDEAAMVNEVMRAQLLPDGTRQGSAAAAQRLTQAPRELLSAALTQPVSFRFRDVPLSDVIEFISDAANLSIIPSPRLDLTARRVSLTVNDLPLEQAVKYLARSLSLAYRVEPDAILIAAPEEFSSEPLETRVFFLRNGLGPFALATSAVEPNPALAMESIRHLIEQTIPQVSGGKLVMDERSGALIVTNTTQNLALVERLLSQLDVTPTQVLIEARFVELTMTDLEQAGLESVLTGNAALTKKGSGDGTQGAGHQVAGGGGFKFPALSRETEGLNLTLQGVLTGTQFETVLHALEESKKSKTLSAPRVTTLNHQTASIRVVEEFNYPTRYEVSLIQFDINGDGD
ncbi:MAG: hypothetical protein HYY59_08060, partial [Candidatus Omnitrophica bacterium]|nr:hypothetical protein [Candidatus Omnitrophota bacterium]